MLALRGNLALVGVLAGCGGAEDCAATAFAAEAMWSSMATSGAVRAHTAVWTGSEMLVFGGVGSGVAVRRYDPRADQWSSGSSNKAPAERAWHTGIWTGSEMLVWGGTGNAGVYFDGGRYDPVNDTWAPIASDGAPTQRFEHTAVWTGSLMIVWGGTPNGTSGVDSGGRYDPSEDDWEDTSTTGAPSGRYGHVAAWTGSEMVVWGGGSLDGARYDPVEDRWTRVMDVYANSNETSSATAGLSHGTAVWSGSEMLVWGGGAADSLAGGRYDPDADRWRLMSLSGAPLGLSAHTSVWVGDRGVMLAWGGDEAGTAGASATGGAYDPVADCWAALTMEGAPTGRWMHSAVWSGSEMIVWGGGAGHDFGDGGRLALVKR